MPIDVSTPEGRNRELRNISLLQAKKHAERAMAELNFLIMSTPSGNRRNTLTTANIHMMAVEDALKQLRSEELPGDELGPPPAPKHTGPERRSGWGDLPKA